MTSEVVGEIEKEQGVMVVRRIYVTYHLRLARDKREVAERVLGFHADYCPLARTIGDCVEISTALQMEDLEEETS